MSGIYIVGATKQTITVLLISVAALAGGAGFVIGGVFTRPARKSFDAKVEAGIDAKTIDVKARADRRVSFVRAELTAAVKARKIAEGEAAISLANARRCLGEVEEGLITSHDPAIHTVWISGVLWDALTDDTKRALVDRWSRYYEGLTGDEQVRFLDNADTELATVKWDEFLRILK